MTSGKIRVVRMEENRLAKSVFVLFMLNAVLNMLVTIQRRYARHSVNLDRNDFSKILTMFGNGIFSASME